MARTEAEIKAQATARKKAAQRWVNWSVRNGQGVTQIDRRCFEIGFDYGYEAGTRAPKGE